MRIFPRPLFGYLALLFLFVLVVYRGVFPAFTQIDTDFPNYYTAARIVLEQGDVNRLYDDQWFQEQITAHRIQAKGKFSPFPPTTALLATPLGLVQPQTALRLLTLVNLICVSLCVILLAQATSFEFPDVAVFVLLAGVGLINCIRFGQWYILVALSIIAGYVLYQHGRFILSGICFGLFVPVKYFPILFVLYFAARKEWRLVVSAIATSMLLILVSMVVLGWEIHYTFLTSVLGEHLQSRYALQSPFSSTFQSFDSLLHQLMVYDPEQNPHPAILSADMLPQVKWGIVTFLVLVTVVSIFRSQRFGASASVSLSFSLLSVLGLLIAPGGATYHFVLLWLPCALLLQWLDSAGRNRLFLLTLLIYGAIGFIPYSLFHSFEGRGWLSVLAFPRLCLMILLFFVAVLTMWLPATRQPLARNV